MAYGDNIDEGYSEGEEHLHFYYNQEERLKRAPKIVQDYYSGEFKLNKGFRVLVANRGNRFILIVLVLCLLMVGFTSLFASFDKGKIENLNFTLSAFSFEEEIYVSLKVNSAKRKSFPVNSNAENSSDAKKSGTEIPVKVDFSCFDADKQLIFTKTIEGIFSGEELYIRTKFSDYDILSVRSDVEALERKCTLTSTVQRK